MHSGKVCRAKSEAGKKRASKYVVSGKDSLSLDAWGESSGVEITPKNLLCEGSIIGCVLCGWVGYVGLSPWAILCQGNSPEKRGSSEF